MERFIHLLIGCCLLITYGCQRHQENSHQVPCIKVVAQRITQQKQALTHTYTGVIKESASIPLSMQANGIITDIWVKKGDRVTIGQSLVSVDTTQAYYALQIAAATLQQTQDGYTRARQVYDQGGITEQKMVELSSQLQQAQSMYNIAKQRLENCTLVALRNGVVGSMDVQIGQNIAAGIPIITLIDINAYQVSFDVPESDMTALQINDIGSIDIQAIGWKAQPIRIIEKNLIANRIAHTYTIVASIDTTGTTAKQQLFPGLICQVILPSKTTEGLIVPTTCIHTLQDGQVIWKIQAGKAIRQKIEIGNYMPTGILVTQGLNIGDTIIVEGTSKLYNGTSVCYESIIE